MISNSLKFVMASYFLLLALSVVAQEQHQLSKKDSVKITKVFYEQQEAWNRGDIEQFMEGYWKNQKLVFVGSTGPTYGWSPVKSNYYDRYPDKTAMGQLKFTVIELAKIEGKSAFLIGSFHLTRTIGDLDGYFTLVWRKIKGNWLIVSDHTSVAK